MAKTVKTSEGKCWSEGVEVSCPNERTQTRKMTGESKSMNTRKEIDLNKAYSNETERRRKFSWG